MVKDSINCCEVERDDFECRMEEYKAKAWECKKGYLMFHCKEKRSMHFTVPIFCSKKLEPFAYDLLFCSCYHENCTLELVTCLDNYEDCKSELDFLDSELYRLEDEFEELEDQKYMLMDKRDDCRDDLWECRYE